MHRDNTKWWHLKNKNYKHIIYDYATEEKKYSIIDRKAKEDTAQIVDKLPRGDNSTSIIQWKSNKLTQITEHTEPFTVNCNSLSQEYINPIPNMNMKIQVEAF